VVTIRLCEVDHISASVTVTDSKFNFGYCRNSFNSYAFGYGQKGFVGNFSIAGRGTMDSSSTVPEGGQFSALRSMDGACTCASAVASWITADSLTSS
jgi:hypothetical protein